MAVDQPRQRERHVERVAHVVVEGVAGEVAGILAFEQRLKVGEGPLQRMQLDAWIARGIERQHGVAHARRVFDVDPVGHVVLVETLLHRSRAKAADYSLGRWGKQGSTAGKPGSVMARGFTRRNRQPFLWTPDCSGVLATYPQARPSRP